MNRDDIIRMAREAGFEIGESDHKESIFNPYTNDEERLNAELERFAVLVAAKEREACESLWKVLEIKDDQIRQVIEASVAVEREACAQIAMQWDKEHPSTNFGGCIARSIRERGQA